MTFSTTANWHISNISGGLDTPVTENSGSQQHPLVARLNPIGLVRIASMQLFLAEATSPTFPSLTLAQMTVRLKATVMHVGHKLELTMILRALSLIAGYCMLRSSFGRGHVTFSALAVVKTLDMKITVMPQFCL